MSEPSLVRPSQLARFWGLHPRTLTTWIREGRLAATRSPGAQYRVRVADVRALCEREELPFPPFLVPPARTAVIIGAGEAERRGVRRALKSEATVTTFDDAYAGLFAAVRSPPSLVALGAATKQVDAEAAVRGLRSIEAMAPIPIVVFDIGSAARGAVLERAGATATLSRSRRAELPRTIARLLGVTSP